MCILLPKIADSQMPHTYAGCMRDADVWYDYANKTEDVQARSYLRAAAATIIILAKYLAIVRR